MHDFGGKVAVVTSAPNYIGLRLVEKAASEGMVSPELPRYSSGPLC